MIRIPRAGIRWNIGLQAVAVGVLFVVANYLSYEFYARADFSRSQKFSLATQTRRVIREFQKPVTITAIASPTMYGPVGQILGDVRGLLAEIQFAGRERVVIEYVDPTRDLTRMRELQAKYKFTTADNLIILDYDDRKQFVSIAQMGEFDMRPVSQGEPPVLLAFRGEQALTSAMLALIKPESQAVYFLQGHGEPAVGEGSPISTFVNAIQGQNARVDTLSLASTDKIPADADAVVIVSPKFDLDAREEAVFSAWLSKRGRLIVLLDPDASTPRLAGLLEANGIIPQDDRVLRTVRLPFATGILREVTGEVLPTTEFTRRLDGLRILFSGSTQSLKLDEKLAEKERIKVRPLIQAAEEFWGERDFAPNLPGGVRYDDGRDNGQPLPIAASADRGGIEDDRVEVQTSRLIVVGSSQFAFDAVASPQGMDFLVSGINSLLDRNKVTGVTPKTITHFALNLTETQISRIALFTMVIIPGLSALAGLLVWLKRRS